MRKCALAALVVYITITQPQVQVPCPELPTTPTIKRNEDGTYTRWLPSGMAFAMSCWLPASSHTEEWTDLPENGGTFIRRQEAPPSP
jgi:hypothetical protein